MSELKYNVGDKVRIKSLGWYDENKDVYGYIECGKSSMNFETSQLCGKIVTISRINDATNTYRIEEDNGFYNWTDEMIECKVEDECPQDFIEKYCKSCGTQRCDRTEEYLNGCPYYNAYMCKKQNNAMEEETKQEYDYVTAMNDLMGLEIEKSCILNEFDEYKKAVEEHGYFSEEALARKCFIHLRKIGTAQNVLENFGFNLPDGYIFKDENGNVINTTKIILEKKKKEYPKTYEECAEIIAELTGSDCNPKGCMGYMSVQLTALQKLLICRDAYWKIAGEEMRLGKSWKPRWNDNYQKKWTINFYQDEINLTNGPNVHFVLSFPTKEMRDAFKKNFGPDIEICKEFL